MFKAFSKNMFKPFSFPRFGNIFPQPCVNSLRFVRHHCASSVWKRQRDIERQCPPASRWGYVRQPVRGRFLICLWGNEQKWRKRKQTLNLFCSRGHEIQNLMKEQVWRTASAEGELGRAHLQLQRDSVGRLLCRLLKAPSPFPLVCRFFPSIAAEPSGNAGFRSVGSTRLILLIYRLAQ